MGTATVVVLCHDGSTATLGTLRAQLRGVCHGLGGFPSVYSTRAITNARSSTDSISINTIHTEGNLCPLDTEHKEHRYVVVFCRAKNTDTEVVLWWYYI